MATPATSSTPSYLTAPHMTADQLDNMFSNLENNLKLGSRMTVKHLAEFHGVSISTMRQMLVHHYGANIIFTKGRTGGIKLS